MQIYQVFYIALTQVLNLFSLQGKMLTKSISIAQITLLWYLLLLYYVQPK